MKMGWIYSSLNNGTGEGFQQPPTQLLGLPHAACLNLSSSERITFTAAYSVSARGGLQLSLGTSGYNISSAHKFLPSHALDAQPMNQELEISQKTVQYGKSQR